jgi:hypothetical protein
MRRIPRAWQLYPISKGTRPVERMRARNAFAPVRLCTAQSARRAPRLLAPHEQRMRRTNLAVRTLLVRTVSTRGVYLRTNLILIEAPEARISPVPGSFTVKPACALSAICKPARDSDGADESVGARRSALRCRIRASAREPPSSSAARESARATDSPALLRRFDLSRSLPSRSWHHCGAIFGQSAESVTTRIGVPARYAATSSAICCHAVRKRSSVT